MFIIAVCFLLLVMLCEYKNFFSQAPEQARILNPDNPDNPHSPHNPHNPDNFPFTATRHDWL